MLDANTRIPAHVGVTNTRCTVHVPLIIPPGCGFRVGSTTREWVPGQAWVFDDTINHEAWNLSDTPRAILIFDIWNPLLTAAERDMIAAATEVYAKYYSLPGRPGNCESAAAAARCWSRWRRCRERLAVPAAEALSADLKHCAAVDSAAARLACYDALAGRSAASEPTSAGACDRSRCARRSQPGAGRERTAPRAAPPPRATGPGMTTAAPAAAPVAAPAPAPNPAEAEQNFGLSSAQLHSAPQGPQSIEAHVSQVTQDQALRSFAVLDNGQTWLSTEGGLDLVSGELVTIRRAALGSYMLVSTTSKHSYHVRRVR